MYCDNCGKEIKFIGYNADYKRVCEECFTEYYWNKVLSHPNVIIYKQKAYTFTKDSKNGGFCQKPFTITMLDGTIYKHVGLWSNATVPSKFNVEDNCISIKEER